MWSQAYDYGSGHVETPERVVSARDYVEASVDAEIASDGSSAQDMAVLRGCLEQLVASAFQLDELLLRLPTRGRAEVARARQSAMYLAHTVFHLSLTEVGQMFDRDRTTVAHACRVIEEFREEPAFDRAMDMLERSTRIMQANAIFEMTARYNVSGGSQ